MHSCNDQISFGMTLFFFLVLGRQVQDFTLQPSPPQVQPPHRVQAPPQAQGNRRVKFDPEIVWTNE